MARRSYLILNAILLALIICVFVYSYFFDSSSFQLRCIYKTYFGIECPSCGLTRSFSALLHFDISKSLSYNKFGWQIFLFLFFELLSRLILILIVFFKPYLLNKLFIYDWLLSGILFLIFFSPLIYSTIQFFLEKI